MKGLHSRLFGWLFTFAVIGFSFAVIGCANINDNNTSDDYYSDAGSGKVIMRIGYDNGWPANYSKIGGDAEVISKWSYFRNSVVQLTGEAVEEMTIEACVYTSQEHAQVQYKVYAKTKSQWIGCDNYYKSWRKWPVSVPDGYFSGNVFIQTGSHTEWREEYSSNNGQWIRGSSYEDLLGEIGKFDFEYYSEIYVYENGLLVDIIFR